MRFQRHKAVDFNWITLRINGAIVRAKKHGFKVARAVGEVYRYGSNEVEAFTIGTSKVEDSVIEFDMMGAVSIFEAFGVNDINAARVFMAGKTFEIVERVQDPDTNPLTNAGGWTNIGKGCEVIGIEWSPEATEGATAMSWTVKIKSMDIARGDLGGAGMSLGRG